MQEMMFASHRPRPQPSPAHRQWADQSLKDECGGRDSKWTRSIAVGSKEFTERTKHLLGIKAKGRAVLSTGDTYEVREPEVGYRVDFGLEKNDIGVENAYSWNNTIDISTRLLGPTPVARRLHRLHRPRLHRSFARALTESILSLGANSPEIGRNIAEKPRLGKAPSRTPT